MYHFVEMIHKQIRIKIVNVNFVSSPSRLLLSRIVFVFTNLSKDAEQTILKIITYKYLWYSNNHEIPINLIFYNGRYILIPPR